MTNRAKASGIVLDETDGAIAKGMILRGDRQHDVAAWFGVNGGRIGEIASGRSFAAVAPADPEVLPPAGPYQSGREAAVMREALAKAKAALERAEALLG